MTRERMTSNKFEITQYTLSKRNEEFISYNNWVNFVFICHFLKPDDYI